MRTFVINAWGGTLPIAFSVVCNNAVIMRYQKLNFSCAGDPGAGNVDLSDRVLLGPNSEPGLLNSQDDTVFELSFLEAFEGFDAQCNIENIPALVRFSKQ